MGTLRARLATPNEAAGIDVSDLVSDPRTTQAHELMARFGDRTGLTSDRPPVRYLWTDAFAVCNLLGVGQVQLALRLVDEVHDTLGRHRADDERSGWISGLDPEEGAVHPTAGGLRIGKRLPERGSDQPFDDRLEWDRDGQYFHLTKWMHALDQVARLTGQPRYNVWACELADVAHRAFTDHAAGAPRMVWKMSVDLSSPLVPSMGQHDPLDGYITCVALDATAAKLGASDQGPRLTAQAADLASMIPADLATTDPLGLAELLADAWRVVQLERESAIAADGLLDRLLESALIGLGAYGPAGKLRLPADQRLAFRELGLAIGLAAIPMMDASSIRSPRLERLGRFVALRDEIELFWLHPPHRRTATWVDHQDINDVMLATSLVPEGYLTLRG